MRNIALSAVIATSTLLAACGGSAKSDAAKASPSPAAGQGGFTTEEEKTFYAMGYNFGKGNGSHLQASAAEAEAFTAGVRDGMTSGTPKVDVVTQSAQIQPLLAGRAEKVMATTKAKGLEFQKAAAAEAGAVKLPSGVIYRTLAAGTGKAVARTDAVRVNYVGTLADGNKFDASADHGGPATFELSKVVPCFAEGLSRMKVGEKGRLVCPPETAYGDRDQGAIPAGSTLVFDLEVVDVVAPGKAAAQR